MKTLTRTEYEIAFAAGDISIDRQWGAGTKMYFVGSMEGETETLFKVTGL